MAFRVQGFKVFKVLGLGFFGFFLVCSRGLELLGSRPHAFRV